LQEAGQEKKVRRIRMRFRSLRVDLPGADGRLSNTPTAPEGKQGGDSGPENGDLTHV